jgi:hypothetical protein
MAQLKRIIRYLAGTADRHLRIAPHHKWELLGEGDADWAGDPTERKSCSGGVVFLAGAVILTYARVQHARALSSCESELYSLGSLSVELLYLDGFLREIGFPCSRVPRAFTDSSSALTSAGRRGPGRMRHVQLRDLAMQDWQRAGRITYQKILGLLNCADFLTKFAKAESHDMCVKKVGLEDP